MAFLFGIAGMRFELPIPACPTDYISKTKGVSVKSAISIIVLACFGAPAIAADGRWTEGFGQGNLEYFIDSKGVRLLIGCPTKDGNADAPSSISLYRISDNAPATQFSLSVAGVTYDGPFETGSRVQDNNFISLLENLRKGDAVVKVGGKTLTFPKSNVAKVVPVFGKKGFSCNIS